MAVEDFSRRAPSIADWWEGRASAILGLRCRPDRARQPGPAIEECSSLPANRCQMRASWQKAIGVILFAVALVPQSVSGEYQANMSLRGGSLYTTLGVTTQASQTEIRTAYKKLALEWHPDKNPGRTEKAAIRFREVQDAYDVLSDPHKRGWYDRTRGSSSTSTSPNAQPHHPAGAATAADIEAVEKKLAAVRKEVLNSQKEMASVLGRLKAVMQKRLACRATGTQAGA
mmetsp:Transcript_41299/g.83022  ORF Transcript_41299/g.83022 Transcript_41299/m.83022 type:complete len:229 (-) Transcript_41299:183-869(-)